MFFGWNPYAIVFDLQSPRISNVIYGNEYVTFFRSIFQGIGYDVLQDGVHFLFIEPHIHVTEVTFISERNVLYGSVCTENIVYLLYISIQFIFCYVQMGGIYFCPFEVYQIGGHVQE